MFGMAPKRSPGLPPPYRDPALEWLIANDRLATTSTGSYQILPAPETVVISPKVTLMTTSCKARPTPALSIPSSSGPSSPTVLMKAVAKYAGRAPQLQTKAFTNSDAELDLDATSIPTPFHPLAFRPITQLPLQLSTPLQVPPPNPSHSVTRHGVRRHQDVQLGERRRRCWDRKPSASR